MKHDTFLNCLIVLLALGNILRYAHNGAPGAISATLWFFVAYFAGAALRVWIDNRK